MLVKVKVTQEDINTGLRGSCSLCPVALAVNRVLKAGLHATVDQSRIFIRRAFEILQDISTPTDARWFISAFDGAIAMSIAPFEFDLEVPQEVMA
jgi:hypothetical protein